MAALQKYTATGKHAGDFDYWFDPDLPDGWMICRWEGGGYGIDCGGEIKPENYRTLKAAHAAMVKWVPLIPARY